MKLLDFSNINIFDSINKLYTSQIEPQDVNPFGVQLEKHNDNTVSLYIYTPLHLMQLDKFYKYLHSININAEKLYTAILIRKEEDIIKLFSYMKLLNVLSIKN